MADDDDRKKAPEPASPSGAYELSLRRQRRRDRIAWALIMTLLIGLGCFEYYQSLTSTVQGVVTYQAGVSPDSGAMVYVLNKATLAAIKDYDGFYYGIVKEARADARGNFSIDNVPSGEYDVLIISQHATRDCAKDDKDMSRITRAALIGAAKVYITHISVHGGKTVTINHDFGYALA